MALVAKSNINLKEDKEVGKIFETYNLKKFKKIEGNRVVNELHVNELIKSIKENGYVGEPILVNEKLEVIDGQHRLAACKKLFETKELTQPITYAIIKGLGQAEMIVVNRFSKDWTIETYVESYASRGLLSYEFINDMKNDHNLSIGAFIEIYSRICSDKTKKKIKENIYDGTFTITDDEQNEFIEKLSMINRFHVIFYASKSLNLNHIKAYLDLISYDDFDKEHFFMLVDINNKRTGSKALQRISGFKENNPCTQKEIVSELVNIYNSSRSKKIKEIAYDKPQGRLYTL